MLGESPLRTVRDRVLILRSLPNFAGMDDEGAKWVAEHAKVRQFAEGEVIAVEGEPIHHVYIVTAGCIRATRKTRVVDIRRGFGLGFLAVLGHDQQGVHAQALEPSAALEVPAEAMLSVYEENFSMVRGALRNLARSLLEGRGNLPARPDTYAGPIMGVRRDTPMTLVERVLAMRETGLFSSVNMDAVIDMARRQDEVHIAAGTSLWALGDPPDYSLRINYGHVRCTEASGRSVVVGAEFVLGSMDALSDTPRRFAAETVTEVQGFRFGQDTFLSVLESHPQVALELAGLLARGHLDKS